MVAKELPNNEHSLKLLFKQTEKLLSDLEPIRQKITPLPLYVQKMIKGNLNPSDEEDYLRDIAALQNAYSKGIQIRETIKDYLEQDDTIQQNQDLPDAMEVLDDLVGKGNAEEIKNFQLQNEISIIKKCAMLSRATNRVGQLQKQIFDKLERLALSRNTPSRLKDESFKETDGASVVGNQASAHACPYETPLSPVRTANKSARSGPRMKPQPDFEKWGIGIDHKHKWQVFECYGEKWRHKEVMNPQPARGLQMNLLQAFSEIGKPLDKHTIVTKLCEKATASEKAEWYKNTFISTVSLLRTRLRKALGFQSEANPILYENPTHSYSLFIMVGTAIYENSKYIFEYKK